MLNPIEQTINESATPPNAIPKRELIMGPMLVANAGPPESTVAVLPAMCIQVIIPVMEMAADIPDITSPNKPSLTDDAPACVALVISSISGERIR